MNVKMSCGFSLICSSFVLMWDLISRMFVQNVGNLNVSVGRIGWIGPSEIGCASHAAHEFHPGLMAFRFHGASGINWPS